MKRTTTPIQANGKRVTVKDVAMVARFGAAVEIADSERQAMSRSRAMLDQWVSDEKIIYGVTTGFGPFVSTLIPTQYQSELQQNLIRSHAANVGPVFSREETRAAMFLRLNAFAKGYSAVRMDVIDLLLAFLDNGIHPQVPEWGSMGASGDLNPSAHIALALMGEGTVEYGGTVMPTKEALNKAGLQPVTFMAKEGLALINGTTMMTGVGAIQVHDAWQLVKTAEVVAALSIEALGGSIEPFLAEGHELAKPHPGQIKTAENLRTLLADSELIWQRKEIEETREKLRQEMREKNDVVDSGIHMQNAYSLRATPQIVGAVRDALEYVTARITTEINSANDNPLFFPDSDLGYQGANFHGQPVALPFDVLTLSLVTLGNISERRLNRMLDATRSNGLSPFLARGKSGLRCGMEGAQYIAASLIAECRSLATPVSIQSIPTNGENQDVVSLGLVAARKARDVLKRLEYVIAVELLAAVEALEERDITKLSRPGRLVYDTVRAVVTPYDVDTPMQARIEAVAEIVRGGSILDDVQTLLKREL